MTRTMKLLALLLLSLLAPSSATPQNTVQASFMPVLLKRLLNKKHNEISFSDEDLVKWGIFQVKYDTNRTKLTPLPLETFTMSTITNNECQPVVKKVTLTKTYELEQRWDVGSATTQKTGGSITAQIPFIGSAGVEFSSETMRQFSKGTSLVDSIAHSLTLEQNVPPNHSCSASMVGHKYKAKLPFTAFIYHVYKNKSGGGFKQDLISGTYDSTQVGEVRAVVDRCKPIPNAKPCA